MWPWVILGVVVIAGVCISVLPASLIGRALPPDVRADDYSGTVWHGSAGKIMVNGIDAGGLEWRLHPAALLRMTISTNVHWVKTGFVLDGDIEVNRGEFSARDLRGGGPLEDLGALGLAPLWSGIAAINVTLAQGDFSRNGAVLKSLLGDVEVDNLASQRYTSGADIGGYRLHAADGAITPDADASAELNDTGGPLEVHGSIHYTAKERRFLLSGTVRERGNLPPALQEQLRTLGQLRPRDAQGRLPVDLEFTL